MKWNAELYENFGKERLQPAIDLVNRIPDGDYKRIVDIGCGSGMSTFPLRQRFSEAEIIGVDSSCEMLEKAKSMDNNQFKIRWELRDCSRSLDDLGKFDLVFSNAFLQWLREQEQFLERVSHMLNTGGILALQVPNYDNMPIKRCIDEIVAQYGHRFDEVQKSMCHNYTMKEYYDMLCRYFDEVTIWQTNYAHVMENHEEIVKFMSATGLRPYFEYMSEEEQAQMSKELIKKLAVVYPLQGK